MQAGRDQPDVPPLLQADHGNIVRRALGNLEIFRVHSLHWFHKCFLGPQARGRFNCVGRISAQGQPRLTNAVDAVAAFRRVCLWHRHGKPQAPMVWAETGNNG